MNNEMMHDEWMNDYNPALSIKEGCLNTKK